jgi:hypothetical protein
VSIVQERIETAFAEELARIEHEGFGSLLKMRFDAMLYRLYRHGYIRGHADHSRESRQQEEQDRREGKFPMNVDIRYDNGRLILDGKDRTPERVGADG